jgi:hypothetical protein
VGTLPGPSRLPEPSPLPFTLAVLLIAVAVSYVRGGRLQRLVHAPLRWSWLLLAGLLLQVAVDAAVGRGLLEDASLAGWSLLFLSQLLVLTWVLRNRHLPGMLLVGLGLLLNMVVVAANGAMPVDPDAIMALGGDPAALEPGKHTLLTEETRLPWLADVWALPPLRSIISVGDVVLAAGLIPLAHALMTFLPAEERRRQRT